MSRKKEPKATVQDAYDEGNRTLSGDEAHRDVVYHVPSSFRHVCTCFMIQMKRYTKQKSIWFMLFLLIVIPAAIYFLNSISADIGFSFFAQYTANENMSAVLLFLPVLGILIPCIMCGKMLPQEFNERTAYLSFPLPMSRSSFYIGKFLAGFVISAGIMIAAYGIALLSCRYIVGSTVTFSVPILLSLAVMACATFFFCSYSYMKSSKSKRGSTLGPFMMLIVVYPILAYILVVIAYRFEIPVIRDILGYLPSFADDLALSNLGSGLSLGSLSLNSFGPFGLSNTFALNATMGFSLGSSIVISCAVCVILGLICLYIGYTRVSRRDM